jgi:hypothetical protein
MKRGDDLTTRADGRHLRTDLCEHLALAQKNKKQETNFKGNPPSSAVISAFHRESKLLVLSQPKTKD